MTVHPFRIDIRQSVLEDLKERLWRTRWSGDAQATDWDRGTNPRYLEELCTYWRDRFDWQKQQDYLNTFAHYRADIDGIGIHFIHERSKAANAVPLLLVHGWPDSFARFLKIIPMLTDPQAHGGDAADSFDVIVPSLPGYGFSDKPRKPELTFEFGRLLHGLMIDVLGYRRFAVQGGDWGGMVAEHLARSYGSSVIGIQMTDVPYHHMFQKPSDPSAAEQKYLQKMEDFEQKKGAYALIQGTRPLSLAQGLNDSPSGLAAWLVEKFQGWSDCDGDVEKRFTKDELLTHVMIYWVTETIGSSFCPYYDMANAGALRWISETIKKWVGSSDVPAGFALFPKDLVTPPREWAARFFNVQRWTEMPRGGHFAAAEEPQLLAEEIRATFRPLRPGYLSPQ
jgi:pimeloyl-ACP methyl ester carboxylesterase